MTPFLILCEFTAHEQQLLARMGVHVREVCAQIREALPLIAGHAANQRTFAMHNLIVRKRQHKVLTGSVHESKSHLVVMMLAMHRFLTHV